MYKILLSIIITALLAVVAVQLVIAHPSDLESLKERDRRLAEYWSPVICQDICEKNYRKDYILEFNFDRDYDAWNNTENIENMAIDDIVSSETAIYYWVIETETHYFIGYGFFHPEDWKVSGSHENDFEGIILCVKKDKDDINSPGYFLALVTKAHIDEIVYLDEEQLLSKVISLSETYESDVDFIENEVGMHPIIYAEAKGHGAYADFPSPKMFRFGFGVDEAPIFSEIKKGFYENIIVGMTDIRTIPEWVAGKVGDDLTTFDRLGIVYTYSKKTALSTPPMSWPEDMGDSEYYWPKVTYGLVTINELWNKRYENGHGNPYITYGKFGGDDGGKANPPWGWRGNQDPYQNPAAFFSQKIYLAKVGEFSRTYQYKSYDTVYETQHPYEEGMYDNWFNWTVPGSSYLTLNFNKIELAEGDHIYIYNKKLEEVAQFGPGDYAGQHKRVDGDLFYLKFEVRSKLPKWGFALDSVDSNYPPYLLKPEDISLEVDEGDALVFNWDLLPAEDPEDDPEICYRFDWDGEKEIEWDTGWVSDIGHTFEDNEKYGRFIQVQLSDGEAESEIWPIGLVVSNVPPDPRVVVGELSSSSPEKTETALKFTMHARDPAGEYDQPYTYNVTITRHGDEYQESKHGFVTVTVKKRDKVYLDETWQGGINFSFEKDLPEGSYDINLTVEDDSGAFGRYNLSFSVGEGHLVLDSENTTVGPDGCDYSSIQKAVDEASSGDIIEVYSGTYHENVNVNKRLVLRGVNTGGGLPVVNGKGCNSAVSLSADGITLEKLVVINSGTGIKVNSKKNNIVRNIVSKNGCGIYIEAASNNNIKENEVDNNFVGITVDQSHSNFISNNIITSNAMKGIYLKDSGDHRITYNYISNNLQGICLEKSRENIIVGNKVKNNGKEGVYLRYSDGNLIFENIIIKNKENDAYDETGINQWDSGTVGNYYSDIDSMTLVPVAGEDCRRQIPGGSSVDRYPLKSLSSLLPTQDLSISVWTDKNEYEIGEEITVHYDIGIDTTRRITVQPDSGAKSSMATIVFGPNTFSIGMSGAEKITIEEASRYDVKLEAWTESQHEEATCHFNVVRFALPDQEALLKFLDSGSAVYERYSLNFLDANWWLQEASKGITAQDYLNDVFGVVKHTFYSEGVGWVAGPTAGTMFSLASAASTCWHILELGINTVGCSSIALAMAESPSTSDLQYDLARLNQNNHLLMQELQDPNFPRQPILEALIDRKLIIEEAYKNLIDFDSEYAVTVNGELSSQHDNTVFTNPETRYDTMQSFMIDLYRLLRIDYYITTCAINEMLKEDRYNPDDLDSIGFMESHVIASKYSNIAFCFGYMDKNRLDTYRLIVESDSETYQFCNVRIQEELSKEDPTMKVRIIDNSMDEVVMLEPIGRGRLATIELSRGQYEIQVSPVSYSGPIKYTIQVQALSKWSRTPTVNLISGMASE